MLEASQIECVRGSRRLFRNLSFRLEPHRALRVLGENGSGKTSLLRIVAGLAQAESGSVRWNGATLRALGEDYRRQLLFIGHHNGLKEDLTALENLRFGLALSGVPVQTDDLREGLQARGLGAVAGLPVKLLSQGQKRRVALTGLAFSGARALWVLDEPFAALDTASVSRLAAELSAHLDRGGMVMFTTHQEVDLPGAAMGSVELGAH
jgi:heme exporter protein A